MKRSKLIIAFVLVSAIIAISSTAFAGTSKAEIIGTSGTASGSTFYSYYTMNSHGYNSDDSADDIMIAKIAAGLFNTYSHELPNDNKFDYWSEFVGGDAGHTVGVKAKLVASAGPSWGYHETTG